MKTLAKRAIRIPPIRTLALATAAVRGRGLVLVYHRVTQMVEAGIGVVPSVPVDIFREQIHCLLDVGDVVPLEVLLDEPQTGRRPRFAITLDDDSISHHRVALPVLRGLNLTATFFLCGRRLHGLGPAWFDVLDRLIRNQGLERACRLIGANAGNVEELAVACEQSEVLRRAVMDQEAAIGKTNDQLGQAEIAALTEASMRIGFHTVRHLVLPSLEDRWLEREMVEGRDALAAAASQRISLFAYPHGKADPRVARGARGAGYRAAVTGRPTPTTRRSDPFMLGRWEPGPLRRHDFLAGVAAKLNRGN